MATTDPLFSTDAYLKMFEATVVDRDETGHRVALNRTAFYPGGGGQPHDVGSLTWDGGGAPVVAVKTEGPLIWHVLAPDSPLPDPAAPLQGELDWERRHLLMRTHTALHMLCGVIWAD